MLGVSIPINDGAADDDEDDEEEDNDDELPAAAIRTDVNKAAG
jgi:hypothetical protein